MDNSDKRRAYFERYVKSVMQEIKARQLTDDFVPTVFAPIEMSEKSWPPLEADEPTWDAALARHKEAARQVLIQLDEKLDTLDSVLREQGKQDLADQFKSQLDLSTQWIRSRMNQIIES